MKQVCTIHTRYDGLEVTRIAPCDGSCGFHSPAIPRALFLREMALAIACAVLVWGALWVLP